MTGLRLLGGTLYQGTTSSMMSSPFYTGLESEFSVCSTALAVTESIADMVTSVTSPRSTGYPCSA